MIEGQPTKLAFRVLDSVCEPLLPEPLWKILYMNMNHQDYELGRNENLFDLFLKNVKGFALFTLDPAGRVASWNEAAERLLGYRADEILGQPSSRFFIPEDLSVGEHEKELQTAISQGQASDDRWQVRKDGSRFWASGLTIALKDHDLRGFAKVMRDLTEMRQATDEIRRLYGNLK